MYGAIYGDLAGSVYEFDQTKKVHRVKPNRLITNESFFSDDTILTIAVLDAILNNKDYDTYLREYISRYEDYHPNFSPYFRSAFSPNLMKWSKDNQVGTSRGNGAMMRISPVGFMFNTESEVRENAYLATRPSHNSKEAIDAATTIALMIYYFRKGYSKDVVLNRLKIKVQYTPFKRFNTTCEETLGNCVFCFAVSDSFEDAIRLAVTMGGDTDTNAAIVGSLAEAYYIMDHRLKNKVEEKIPEEFVKVLRKTRK